MIPRIVLNFKSYKEAVGKNALKLCKACYEISRKFKIPIAVCPQYLDVKEIRKKFKDLFIFLQHIDPIRKSGAYTGRIVLENYLAFVDGTLINHLERKLRIQEIVECIKIAKKFRIISLCCASSPLEAKKIAEYKPNIIAIEPPELIGTGISVSKAKPKDIVKTVELVKRVDRRIKVFCGAGITTPDDVEEALRLGSEGVLIASAFVKSKKPKLFLRKIAKVLVNV